MKAGQLRHKITFQERVETNSSSGLVTTWEDYKSAYAGIYPMRGKELIESMQLDHEITHKVRTRYISGVTAKMRIVFESTRYLDIKSIVNPDERRIMLEFLATEDKP